METVTIVMRSAATTQAHVAPLAASVVHVAQGRLVATMGYVLAITQPQLPVLPLRQLHQRALQARQ